MSQPIQCPPERLKTDDTLRAEREKTDDELAERTNALRDEADAVISRARSGADNILKSARDSADAIAVNEDKRARTATRDERRAADVVLEGRRDAEDAHLDKERQAQREALHMLLALEREATDEQLDVERARSDKAVSSRDEFLGMVAHDLRTLLSGIALHATNLRRGAEAQPARPAAAQSADRILRLAARMNRLVGDLIDVTSIDSGQLRVAALPSDAVALARETLDTFQSAAAARGVTLRLVAATASLPAHLDHDRILQVLANVVSNAIKFTPAHGDIAIAVAPSGPDVVFSVSDTGPGIPANQLGAVFQRFWQVSPEDHRGLGLGLYISRCIVEAHGGTICAERVAPTGTVVRFALPVAGPPAIPVVAAG